MHVCVVQRRCSVHVCVCEEMQCACVCGFRGDAVCMCVYLLHCVLWSLSCASFFYRPQLKRCVCVVTSSSSPLVVHWNDV